MIRAILAKKINAWLKSIDDASLREACEEDVIVTGGAIVSLLQGQPPSDYDIYFATYETTVRVAKYYLAKFEESRKLRGGIAVPLTVNEMVDVRNLPRVRIIVKSSGIESDSTTDDSPDYEYFETRDSDDLGASDFVSDVFQDPVETVDKHEEIKQALDADKTPTKEYKPKFLSSNAITLSNQIQIVLRFYGNPETIHSTYDFVHCTGFYWHSKKELHVPAKALEAIMSKTLVYQGSLYPICSLFRIRKFIGRGWRINAGQILKICLQIAELNLKDPRILEDQLTGADVAYFAQVLHLCNEKDPTAIDFAYLVEVVDKLWEG
jgi:hypothetical protein